MYEAAARIVDKHGLAAAFCIGLLVLLWFVGRQAVKALNRMAASADRSASKIADAVNTSAQAQIRAFGALAERVSRVEGTIHALGLAALGVRQDNQGEQPAPTTTHVREVLAEHARDAAEYGDTPIYDVPVPMEPQSVPIIPSIAKVPKTKTPAKGNPYAVHLRPATKGGK